MMMVVLDYSAMNALPLEERRNYEKVGVAV